MSRENLPSDSTLATRLYSLRNRLGMNQEAFAKELGVGQGVVSKWERGEYAPSAESYGNLAKFAARHDLYSEALWFVEQIGVSGAELLAIIKESRSRRDAAYQQGLIEAKTEYPDDEGAQHRYALKFSRRALRRKAKKKE
jgi:transcriptional regulator with XRE-family HTH domain